MSHVSLLGRSRAGTTVAYKTLSASPKLGTLQSPTAEGAALFHPTDHWHKLIRRKALRFSALQTIGISTDRGVFVRGDA